MNCQMTEATSALGAQVVANSYRPLVSKNPSNDAAKLRIARDMVVNSMLRRSEWAQIDGAVHAEAAYPLRAVNDLVSRGLVQRLGGIGTMVAQWYVDSAMTGAAVNMSGTGGQRDMVDRKQAGAPVPIVFKDFNIDARALEASRMLGDGLDVTAAAAAGRVVAEGLESLLIHGSNTQLNGQPLYGYTTHPNRNTDTAGNYGGGDWGTVANVLGTITGMVAAANADNHFGPFMVYAATTQYNQAALTFFSNSDDTPLMRALRLPQIEGFEMLPTLTDGHILLVQMSRNVVEWAEALSLQVREWVSGDGMSASFKVIAVAAPKVKATYDGKSGIVHATGA